jgi:putative endonuclease
MATSARRRCGNWAEQRAARLLQAAGWRLLARQWQCRWGEIDLLLHKPRRLLLVEVKSRRRRGADGWGVASFGAAKRARLRATYSCWLAAHPRFQGCSVELVLALVPQPPARAPVRWIRCWE